MAVGQPVHNDAVGDAVERPLGNDDRKHARLRWRCRRGMLENDLVLTRFLDARDDGLDEDEMAALDLLLRLPDGELWELLSGRAEPEDATLRPLLTSIRTT